MDVMKRLSCMHEVVLYWCIMGEQQDAGSWVSLGYDVVALLWLSG